MSVEDSITILYVPCSTEAEAAQIAARLLEERLIACGNIHATRSIYRWKGKLADETEYVLIAKTAPSLAKAVEWRLAELHSYEVPCIVSIRPERVNSIYAQWVSEQVMDTEPPGSVVAIGDGKGD